MGHLFTVARRVAEAEGLEDYRLVVNNGAGAGQSVFHLHVHLNRRARPPVAAGLEGQGTSGTWQEAHFLAFPCLVPLPPSLPQ